MQKWEYKVVHVYRSQQTLCRADGDNDGEVYGYWGADVAGFHIPVDDVLADLGESGWELCSSVLLGLVPFSNGAQVGSHMLYLRRARCNGESAPTEADVNMGTAKE
jgi:hypothetical protein